MRTNIDNLIAAASLLAQYDPDRTIGTDRAIIASGQAFEVETRAPGISTNWRNAFSTAAALIWSSLRTAF